jgi:hypothetical protein
MGQESPEAHTGKRDDGGMKQAILQKVLKSLEKSIKKDASPEKLQHFVTLINQVDEPTPVEAFRRELEGFRNDLNAVMTRLDMI